MDDGESSSGTRKECLELVHNPLLWVVRWCFILGCSLEVWLEVISLSALISPMSLVKHLKYFSCYLKLKYQHVDWSYRGGCIVFSLLRLLWRWSPSSKWMKVEMSTQMAAARSPGRCYPSCQRVFTSWVSCIKMDCKWPSLLFNLAIFCLLK